MLADLLPIDRQPSVTFRALTNTTPRRTAALSHNPDKPLHLNDSFPMLELLASLVLQTAPTVFPAMSDMKPRSTRKRAAVQSLSLEEQEEPCQKQQHSEPLQGIYRQAVGVFDRMLCCSYSGDQIDGEAPEVDYVEDNSIMELYHAAPLDEDEDYTRRRSDYRDDSPKEFIFLDGSKTPGKPPGYLKEYAASQATASTASLSSTHSWNTLPTRQSTLSYDSNNEFRTEKSWNHRERHWTDPHAAEQELLARVQSDVLADLPYLSATVGYQV